MSTLDSSPVAPLLSRLFADAHATDAKVREVLGPMTPEERARRMSDPSSDYKGFYTRMKDMHLAVSPETGKLLYMLARANGAKAIVEYGTSFALSTIHLAAALRDNGGGRVIASEFEPTKIAHARENLSAAGLMDLVDLREGDAIETLASGLPAVIDGVLLDGHKPLYGRILAFVEPRLRPGSFLVADNADACPEYVERVRRPGSGYVSIPFGEDVELSVRV
jgi:predicted O-methyltransferase YrrM